MLATELAHVKKKIQQEVEGTSTGECLPRACDQVNPVTRFHPYDIDKHSILFDTGHTRGGVLHNLERLGMDLKGIEAIVLSHGHMDHTGSLYPTRSGMIRPRSST